jgi:peptidoglycan hydrolase-like protein with peptidoglycan-binding domain
MHILRTVAAGASLIATVLAASLVGPTAAHASAAQGVISGSGAMTDDFGDEATLSRTGPFRHSTAVALWQSILVYEGLLSDADVDCQFGPTTEAATIRFQRRYGLSADGIVGPRTWSRADDFLRHTRDTVGYQIIDYRSPNIVEEAFFHRLGNGYYETILPASRVWAVAWNTSASQYC